MTTERIELINPVLGMDPFILVEFRPDPDSEAGFDLRIQAGGGPPRERRGDTVIGDMTLGDATEILRSGGWACACSGPVPGSPLCGCQLIVAEARALQRGAHIAVKQLADLAGGPVPSSPEETPR